MTFTPQAAVTWGLGSFDAPDLSFNGTDSFGVQWVVADPDGWERSTTDVPLLESDGDGGSFSPGRRKPRPLTLTGAFRCPDQSQIGPAAARLRAALEHYREDTTIWHTAMPTGEPALQMGVRLVGDLHIDKVQSNPRVRVFSAVLTAADPLKYAAGSSGLVSATLTLGTQNSPGLRFPLTFPMNFGGGTVAGRSTLVNPGAVAAYPTVTYYPGGAGILDTPQLRHLGLGVSEGLGRQLLPYQKAVVDHRYRSVLLDSQSSYSTRLPGTVFFPLATGPNDLSFTAAAYQAGATCTVSFRPAWS